MIGIISKDIRRKSKVFQKKSFFSHWKTAPSVRRRINYMSQLFDRDISCRFSPVSMGHPININDRFFSSLQVKVLEGL